MYYSQKSYWIFACLLFIQQYIVAQSSWNDTFQLYLKTPPNKSVIGLQRALNHKNIPDSTRFDIMVALVNDYAQLRQIDSARNMAVRAYDYAENLSYQDRKARAALSRAWTAREKGLSEEVLEMALKAEQIAKELNRGDLLLMSYNTIASVYYDVKNDSLQKKYLEKSIETAITYKMETQAFNAMSNLGYIYLKEKNYAKAKLFFRKSISADARQNKGNKIQLYMPYSHLVDVYEEEQQYDSCIYYVEQLIDISTLAGWQDYSLLNKLILTFYLRRAGNQISYSTDLLRQLNSVTILNKSIDEQKKFLWEASRINQDNNNYETAIAQRTRFYEITDSLNQVELRDQIAYYKEQFDAEQRETQITQLENQNAIAALEAEQLNTRNTWLIIALSLFGILSTLLVYFYLTLRKTTKELENVNQLKDKFFAIVSHDLRNSITAFHGIGRVMEKYISHEKWDRLNKLAVKLDQESSKLHAFLNDLLNWSLTQVDQVPYNPEVISVSDRITNIISLMDAQIAGKSILVNTQFENNIQCLVDSNAFDLVARNILSNGIKFSHESGTINIVANHTEQGIKILFQDFGVGMTNEQIHSLFKIGTKSTKGTKDESGSGLGLVLVKEFVELNKGTIHVESEPEKGTTFIVQFPKV